MALLATASSVSAQSTYFSGVVTTGIIGTGATATDLTNPVGVAIDASGDVFVSDIALKEVLEFSPTNGVYSTAPTVLAAPTAAQNGTTSGGWVYPVSVAVDPNGNVYVADRGNYTAPPTNGGVYEIPGGSAATAVTPVAVTGGWVNPQSVASDPFGNIFATDQELGVFYITGGPTAPAATAISNSTINPSDYVSNPYGIAADAGGNLYVVQGLSPNQDIQELTPGGTPGTWNAPVTIGPTAYFTGGLYDAVDHDGNLWVSDNSANNITQLSPYGSWTTTEIFGSGFGKPEGVAWDNKGNLLVADTTAGVIDEISTWGINFGSVPVSTASSTIAVPFSIGTAGTYTTSVVTEGATGLDFADAGGSTCAATFASAGTCVVNVSFTPGVSGSRTGAVEILNGTTVVATAYLYGNGTGPQITYQPANAASTWTGFSTAVGSGYTTPAGLAVDAGGNVFVADSGAGSVYEGTTSLASIAGATGVALDAEDNAFVASPAGVTEISGGTATALPVNYAFSSPKGVAVDHNGDLFVVDATNGVQEVFPGGGYSALPYPINNTFSAASALAVDGNGNVFVADTGNNAVKEIVAVNGTVTSSSSVSNLGTFTGVDAIAVDANGSVYVGETGAVVEIPWTGSAFATPVTLVSGLSSTPTGIAVDENGNVYYSEGAGVVKLNRATAPTLQFDDAEVNANSSDSPRTVTVSNAGNTTSITFTGVAFPADFPADASNTCATSTPLSEGVSCALAIDFKPAAATSYTQHVTLTDNAPGSPQSITVKGTGLSITITSPTGTTLPGGTVGTLYDGPSGLQFAASGGTGPYTWAASGTALPAGLTLSTGGLLSGTPTTAGTTTGITISVTDTGTEVVVSQTYSITIAPGATTIAEANETAPYSTSAQNVTLTATLTPSSLNEGTVTFTIAPFGTASAPVTVASGSASISYPIPAGQAGGTYTITAAYTDGAGNYTGSSDATHTLTIGTINQAPLVLTATSPATYNTTQTLSTTGGSGTGAVTYSVGSSTACSVTGSTLTITSGTGTCSVTATKAADTNYNAATSNTVTITVQPATQAALVLTATSPATYNTTQTLAATGGSGTGALTYSVGSSTACSVTGATLTITSGTGTCSVTATKAADANYSAATSNTVTVTVQQATQAALVLTATSPATYNTTQTLAATGGSGTGALTYSVGSSTACSVTGSTLTITSGTGTCSVTATKAADANYSAATSNTVTITVQTATQAALVLTATSPATYNTTQTLAATGGSGTGALTYSVGSSTACSVTGSTLTITSGTGTCSVTATKAADANYSAATSNTVTITVSKATPTITWANPAAITYGTALSATQLDATSTVAGTFAYTPASGTVLSAGAGQTLSVTLTPTDTTDYNAATATVTITVNKATPTITWATPAGITYGTALSATQLDASSTVAGTFAYTPASGTVLTAGTHTLSVTLTPTDTTDYATATTTVQLTVGQATPTITWANPAAITYGTPLGATQLDASSTVAGTFVYTPPAGTVLNAGAGQTLSVKLNPTDTTDYTTATATVTITVNAAAPTITFAVPNHTYGDAPFTVAATSNSTGAITYSVVSGPATIAGSTVTLTGGGTVVLMASQVAAGNYTAGTQTATFTVAASTTNTLTFAAIPPQTYGGAAFTVSASSTSNGAITYSIISGPATINATSGLVTLTGAGMLTIGASQAATASYAAATAQTAIAVAKQASVTTVSAASTSINPNQSATLTATVAGASAVGTPTGTVTFFSGTTQLGTPVTLAGGMAQLVVPTLPSGSDPISATYSGDANFLVSSGSLSGGITVAPLAFTMSATPSSQNGVAGTTFTYQLTVTPTYGTYPGTVSFAATGLPAGATATFTPSTFAANAGVQTVSMAVATTASSTASLHMLDGRKLAPFALAFLLLPLAGTRRMRRQGRRFSQFFCLLLLALAGVAATAALTGCGSNSYQQTTTTSPQNYTITVTATSGSVTQTSTVTLSLQ